MKRVAVITGAGSGFGYELTLRLLKQGWVVWATDKRVEALEPLEALGARTLEVDVTSDHQVKSGFAAVIEAEGQIDLLVANAGFGNFGSIEETSPEAVRSLFEVNVFGVERCIRAVLPGMRQRRSGRILITASVVAHVSLVGLGWYAATKHAIGAIANALRQEVRGLGIRVSVIEPGTVKTGFGAIAFSSLPALGKLPQEPVGIGQVVSGGQASGVAEVATRLTTDYDPVMIGFNKWLGGLYGISRGPKAVVNTMVRAANAKYPRAIYPASIDVRALKLVFYALPRGWVDGLVLWLAKR